MSDKRRLNSNLLQQNVYVRDCVDPFVKVKERPIQTHYRAMDRVTESFEKDGVIHEAVHDRYHIEEYPITREYVNSFADSTNYKLDITKTVSSPAPGPNLGDVASVKQLFEMSPQELNDFFVRAQKMILDSKNPVAKEGDNNE